MSKKTITEIWVIQDENGEIWRDSARATHDQCRDAFIKEWLSRIDKYIDSHTCWNVWNCFQKAGWKISQIAVGGE
jgi:hypothetical protein